jgi:hypothetical protein
MTGERNDPPSDRWRKRFPFYCTLPSPSGSLFVIASPTTGTVMESRTIGHYRPLNEAKAAAQRDHDQNRDQGR